MLRRWMGWPLVLIVNCLFQIAAVQSTAKTPPLPNILWLTCEDTGPELGCYGDKQADTPNIDKLAARGTRYLNCWSNAPVCAPARTTIITGMYPTSLSAQHMRSAVRLPPSIKLIPQYLRNLVTIAPTMQKRTTTWRRQRISGTNPAIALIGENGKPDSPFSLFLTSPFRMKAKYANALTNSFTIRRDQDSSLSSRYA